jgi:hypothetical protein
VATVSVEASRFSLLQAPWILVGRDTGLHPEKTGADTVGQTLYASYSATGPFKSVRGTKAAAGSDGSVTWTTTPSFSPRRAMPVGDTAIPQDRRGLPAGGSE